MSSSSQGARTIQDYELEEEKEYNCRKCGKGFSQERKRNQHEQKKGAHINLMAQWEFRKNQEDQKLSKENLRKVLQENRFGGMNGITLLNIKIHRHFRWLIEKLGAQDSVIISYSWVNKNTNVGSRSMGRLLDLMVGLDMASQLSRSGRTYSLHADPDKLENLRDNLYEIGLEEGYKDEFRAELLGRI